MNQLPLIPPKQDQAAPSPERRRYGLAWCKWPGGRQQWKPFQEWREIRKGKHKGKYEITTLTGRVFKVTRSQVKYFPEV